MSYEIIKNISIKKDGKVFISSSSSNDSPKTYESFDYAPNKSLEEKLEMIFEGLLGNGLVFQDSSRCRVHYAILKSLYILGNKYNSRIGDLWISRYDENPKYKQEEIDKIKAEMYKEFLLQLDSKVNLNEKKYGVKLQSGDWLYKMKKYGYSYSGSKTLFTINQAMAYSRNVEGTVE